MIENAQILLIDDDEESSHNLRTVLAFLGESILASNSTAWKIQIEESGLKSSQFSAAIVANCNELGVASLLQELHAWEGGLPFIMVGEQHLPEDLDSQLRCAITAQLSAQLSYQPLLDALHKAKIFHEHYNRLRDFDGVRDFNMFRSLVGESDALQKVRYMMGQVACKEVSVLITGESGTGKEVVARNLHLNSNRSDKPFIPINCGAIPRELLESELFGHEKGAFTGAIASRAGRFELADGGTLFLDEIGDMPLSMQVKLLRVLQEHSFERVGGVNTLQADVRILAATHKDLEEMIERGEFRQDLYYRINVFPIEMPALRERPEDIPLLLNELIGIMESEKRGSVRFNSAAIKSLGSYEWPGNVRELANLVERMAILYPHGIVGVEDLPEKFRKHLADNSTSSLDSISLNASREASVVPLSKRSAQVDAAALDSGSGLLPLSGIDLKEYLSNLEKDLIEKALSDSSGVVARAADRLQLGRTTLVEKMRKYKLQKPQESVSQPSSIQGSAEGSVEGIGASDVAGKNKSASV
jgi:sigma-54 specific flagellar transcriptional regulator A